MMQRNASLSMGSGAAQGLGMVGLVLGTGLLLGLLATRSDDHADLERHGNPRH